MKAYRFTGWQQPPELLDAPDPTADAGEVVIKVGGSGACHSDLHVMEWPEGQLPWKLPFTLGHEVAGWVEEVGPGVEGFERGDPVAVYGPWGCGRCKTCRQGRENYCERQAEIAGSGGGLGFDGGMAEYMKVPATRYLVPLGDLEPADAAPLSDAALTPYHAIARSLPLLRPGTSAVVIGVGGLGHMGVQILRALTSARIVAVDQDEKKLALAREVGADVAVRAGDEAEAAIREATNGRGAEVVIDFVGADQTMALATKVSRQQGHLTLVGLAMGTVPFNFFAVPYELSLASVYWGTVPELMEVIALAQAGRIRSHVTRYDLDDVAKAYAALKEGTVEGRAVIVP